jgi:hypothetical protein
MSELFTAENLSRSNSSPRRAPSQGPLRFGEGEQDKDRRHKDNGTSPVAGSPLSAEHAAGSFPEARDPSGAREGAVGTIRRGVRNDARRVAGGEGLFGAGLEGLRGAGLGASLTFARARRMKKRAPAAFLWALAFYVAAQAFLVAAVSRWNPHMPTRVLVKKRKRLWELAKRKGDRPLLVMLGSSRTEGAFEARRLDGLPGPGGKPLLAYNYGVPTNGPVCELTNLREMLEAGIRPSLLLVEFLPPLLNEPQRGFTSEEAWMQPPWISASRYLKMRPYFSRPARMQRRWLAARLAPWYVLRDRVHGQILRKLTLQEWPKPRPHDPWGELLDHSPAHSNEDLRRWVAFDMYYASLQNFRLGKKQCQAMRDLVALCRHEKIPVVLVLLPESTEFRRWYLPEGLAATHRVLDELRADFGVPVIDGADWVADADFVDGHHVRRNGARVFTLRLIDELRPFLPRLIAAGR